MNEISGVDNRELKQKVTIKLLINVLQQDDSFYCIPFFILQPFVAEKIVLSVQRPCKST